MTCICIVLYQAQKTPECFALYSVIHTLGMISCVVATVAHGDLTEMRLPKRAGAGIEPTTSGLQANNSSSQPNAIQVKSRSFKKTTK